MASCASSIIKSTNFFCNPMPHSTSSSPRKISHRSIPCIKIQSWRLRSLPRREFLPVPVSSRLRRHSRRGNSLREKLIGSGGAQVREIVQIPVFDSDSQGFVPAFDGSNAIDSNSDESFDFSGGGSSVMRDKLDNWVDQYKRDSEFWGVGSGHVFTVFQDYEDNVVRVLVNEDEIAKRSQIKAWSFQHKDGIDEISDVKSKIAHANRIAKGIEAGEYVIPKSSSIAEFVVEGKKASLVEGLRSVSLRVEPFFKLIPRIGFMTGFMTLCGCCIFWAVSKLFVVSEKMELSSEEVEMLRRKKKARMKREEVNKDNVEVLQDVSEFPVEPYKRPQLDRSDLMKSIMHATTSRNSLALMESPSDLDVGDREFNEKVKEIREMARQARELERQEHAQIDEKDEGDDISSLLLAAKGGSASKYVYTGTKSRKEEPHEDDIGSIGPFADSKMIVAEADNCSNSSSDDGVSKTITSGNGAVTRPVRDLKSDVTRLFDKIPTKKDTENTVHGCNTGLNEVKEEVSESRNMDAIIFPERKTYNSSTDAVSGSPVSRKPKIIGSVKEAREYLAQKRAASLVDVQPSQVMQVKGETRIHKAHNGDFHIKAIGKKVQASNSDTKLIEPSKPNKLNDHGLVSTAFELSDSSHANGFDSKIHPDDVSGSKSDQAANEHRNIKIGDCMIKEKIDPKFQIRNGDHRIVELSDESLSIYSDTPTVISGMTSVGSDGISYCEELQNCRMQYHMPGRKFEKHKDGTCASDKKIVGTNINKGNTMKSKKVEFSTTHIEHGTLLDDPANSKACGCGPSLHDSQNEQDLNDLSISQANFLQDSTKSECNTEAKAAKAEESWLEKNFQELDPIIKKMAVGFKENYMMAKEKVQEMPSLNVDLSELRLVDGNEELEWMNDDNLREIVFQVRDNELAGRDPFHLMDADDKRAFFGGLERKVEKLNNKLLGLHEWVHSRVENLDYGAGGISLDDPPEKIIPRWKGPSVDKASDFLKCSKDDFRNSLQKPQQVQNSSGSPLSLVNARGKASIEGDLMNPKTIIECSDGSSRAGKKKGKEHWEHTKRWSQGFLEVYNAEKDPEIKSILKDMGKDLDRWFTEKDRQDVADLMTRLTERRRKFIEKKIDKVKREMQMFGSQAVISKYKEYSDEKEEDYLWWLDLHFVLCIELYTIEDGKPRVGFYSLEMAADLDFNPKQYHVIAFEDPGDSKNFCHIMQAHMDMLGSGKAFVIARPPKDAFREAKSNGFNVTVIRKGEIKLNVDQTLEEVEEEIVEIGSKIYHDKIMHERSVDVRALMKGVINAEKSTKRSRQVLKKP